MAFVVVPSRLAQSALLGALLTVVLETRARAQDEAAINVGDTETPGADAPEPPESHANTIAGEFTPGRGFDLVKTSRGSLNISFYGVIRYLNQMPDDQVYVDHLGNLRPVVARHDLNWHRSMIWFSGFFWDPKFQYTLTVWSLPTTEQNLTFGLLRYQFAKWLTLGAGVGPSLTARSMQGSWPYWAGSDRVMAEEFYRGGFATALFATGQPIDRFYYTLSVNRSLSQLGIPALFDNRDFAYSASVWTMPTTGEFGPRGGFGDLEEHQQVATRFGMSAAHAKESRNAAIAEDPRHFQLKLSDGVNPFDAGALADGVTVLDLDYDELAFDAGLKYKGFSFQAEYGIRRLSDFVADGPLPQDSILDHGFYAQAMYMVVKRHLGVYANVGALIDDFDRYPWEVGGGASYYPFGNRNLRLNLHYIHIDQSPTGSPFGYYTAGQTGNTVSLGVDVLL
jgi:hypothetical protein